MLILPTLFAYLCESKACSTLAGESNLCCQKSCLFLWILHMNMYKSSLRDYSNVNTNFCRLFYFLIVVLTKRQYVAIGNFLTWQLHVEEVLPSYFLLGFYSTWAPSQKILSLNLHVVDFTVSELARREPAHKHIPSHVLRHKRSWVFSMTAQTTTRFPV